MNFPSLPDWLPWWVPILVAIPLGLWALTMLIMPFNVIGVKSRLEAIEARLDEVQGEIRTLVLRLPESPAERVSYRQSDYEGRAAAIDQGYVQPAPPPPIPPQRRANDFIPRTPAEPPEAAAVPARGERPRRDEPRREESWRDERPAPSPRAEPRLDWRR